MAGAGLAASSPRLDLADVRRVDPVIGSDDDLLAHVRSDCGDICVGESSFEQSSRPSPLHGVSDVLSIGPVAQMLDADTGRVVAGVQDVPVRFTEMVCCHNAMGEHGFLDASESDASVSVGIARPREDEAVSFPDRQGDDPIVGRDTFGRLPLPGGVKGNSSPLPVVVELAETFAEDGAIALGTHLLCHNGRI